MEKVLGLDLGTNSIGWAIVDRDEHWELKLANQGVHIFQEGVKIEKGVESSKAADRTAFRSLRKHYFRRRLRKIETIKALSELGLCPTITADELKAWKQKGEYPMCDAFIEWQRTDDAKNKNPYQCRYLAVAGKVNNKHIVGRALYHIAQRRGFLSNRLESTKESDGKVAEGIDALNKEIKNANCRTLGEYFYKCYGQKVRTRYTSRITHYKAEFDEICRVQQISDADKQKLEHAIFFQRQLKSQKGLVGRCTFEPKKTRCPISHPRYEYYRMLCFVNNIRIKTPADSEFRPLNDHERAQTIPLFDGRVAEHFKFEDIAKKLAGKNNYGTKDAPNGKPYLFNYPLETTVSGMPVAARLINIFGTNIADGIRTRYTLANSKTDDELINDVWHVIFSFDKEENLRQFATEKLRLNADEVSQFLKIPHRQEYAALSLKAINKIVKYLERGYIYSHAVFLANIKAIISADDWAKHQARIESGVGSIIDNYDNYKADIIDQNEMLPTSLKQKIKTKQELIFDFLLECGCHLVNNYDRKLYHPSMIETFASSATGKLNSPRTSSVRNPMAMRTLFQLRRLINRLLSEGQITTDTKINIELARELNNANKRKAIVEWQRGIEKENRDYAGEIKALTGIEPTTVDILKYRLWKEQNGICLYTGKQIEVADFIGANPKFDIEHTIARSIKGDDSQMNKTLCEAKFNRDVKGAKLPSELSNFDEIVTRIEGWKERVTKLNHQIEQCNGRYFATKDEKDKNIIARNKLSIQRNYWKGKYDRMTVTSVESGFKNSQLVDAGIISKYAKQYLKSLFPQTYAIKGEVTADFRKLWGIEEPYQAKDRSNHIHHCIDAIVIACIGKYQNDVLSHYKLQEQYQAGRVDRPTFKKPWPTFTQDVKNIVDQVLVSHYTPDNLGKQTRKRVRIHGKIVEGQYIKGDTARGSLHQETYYGAILQDDKVQYVVRKSIKNLEAGEVSKIVDAVVRDKVESAIAAHGIKAIQDLEKCPIWMNEDKCVQIKKVRCFATHVTSPLHIRSHRDQSPHPHKQQFHVANDGNYAMAIYQGLDKNGAIKRDFEIINNLSTVVAIKQNEGSKSHNLFSLSKKELPIKGVIKTGTMVLFWKESPEEIWELTPKQLKDRLYKVIKFEKVGRVTFKHHQESRNDDTLKNDYFIQYGTLAPPSLTNGSSSIDFDNPAPKLRLSLGNFNMLISGYDFELTITGAIKPLK